MTGPGCAGPVLPLTTLSVGDETISHTLTIKAVEVKNTECLTKACERLTIPAPEEGLHRLFDGTKRQGQAVRLKGWREPVVFDTNTGEALYDNYGGRWGEELELDRLLQAYTIEVAESEARANGYSEISEEVLTDGTVKVLCSSY
jgi:hypothetical protein